MPKIALCLSGGGFRATLFHLGSLRRLNEFGILGSVDAVSSVSGGSITNGVLATRWKSLGSPNADGVFERFQALVAEPLMKFCSQDLRTEVLLWDRANPLNWPKLLHRDYSVTDRLAEAYSRDLGLGVPLSTIPGSPDFIFCAANVENGVSWEFHRSEMGDYKTGRYPVGNVTVAHAVAASSAYPVTFPPLVLKVGDGDDKVTLTDGGVYDNLGLEPVSSMSRHETDEQQYDVLLVSDAGAPFGLDESPGLGPMDRITRSLGIIWNQNGALRKRWLIERFKSTTSRLGGTYWGLSSNVDHYGLERSPGFRDDSLKHLTQIRTDLDPFSDGEIGCLINHGYATANVAIRRWARLIAPNADAQFQWPDSTAVDDLAVAESLRESNRRGIWSDIVASIERRL